MKNKRTAKNLNEHIFQSINYIVFFFFTFVCVYPFYYLFLVSVSNPVDVANGQVVLIPSEFSLFNYEKMFLIRGIAQAFFISASRAVFGTIITVFTTSLFAYALTKKDLFGRKFMYRFTIFTMYASAGLIPWYITMKYLGLDNNYLLYILPYVISPFGLILIKTYMESISPYLEESALVDGAGYLTIFIKIIMPISKPILAAVSVYSAVWQWNLWQDNFFLVGNAKLQTLQLLLINFTRDAESFVNAQNLMILGSMKKLNPFALKTTIAIFSAIPIILVYPLMQKYFIKGIMLGSVKG